MEFVIEIFKVQPCFDRIMNGIVLAIRSGNEVPGLAGCCIHVCLNSIWNYIVSCILCKKKGLPGVMTRHMYWIFVDKTSSLGGLESSRVESSRVECLFCSTL